MPGIATAANAFEYGECSHRSLGSVNEKLEVMSSDHYLIGQTGEESQFEGIAYK